MTAHTASDTDYLPTAATRYPVRCPQPACTGQPHIGRVWHRSTSDSDPWVARSTTQPGATICHSARAAAEWVLDQHDAAHHRDDRADPCHAERRRTAAIDLSLSTL